MSIVELESDNLVATAYDAADWPITSLPVTWHSSNPSIVTVAIDGSIFANRAGTATITATIDGVDGDATVTVTPGVVAGVVVVGLPAELEVGEVAVASAMAVDSRDRPLPGRTATWSSSDPSIASVSATGIVMAVAAGTATLTAEVEGVLGTADIEIVEPAPTVRRRVVMGFDHSCYLDDMGSAWCWGDNGYGQLGDGSFASSDVPTASAAGMTFVSLSAGGYNTCGITDSGELHCWGGDDAMQLGNNGESETPVLVAVGPFSYTTFMYQTGCAVDLLGHPWCWGYSSRDFELGNSTTTHSPVPMQVLPPAGGTHLELVDLRGGEYHACGLTADSRLFCWGYNAFGQLGVGNFNRIAGPVEVFPGQIVSGFGVGEFHACATADGVSYCWGAGYAGQLGIDSDPDEVDTPIPMQSGGIAFTDFAGGYEHTCGLDPTGQAWCWGWNDYGQLGNTGGDTLVPVQVQGSLTFTSISARAFQTCGVELSGAVYCWGDNGYGQLGNGGWDPYVDVPTEVQW
ncbi:MAG TPA: Ig-like domain-containing protein [Vulgatibacter sp.]